MKKNILIFACLGVLIGLAIYKFMPTHQAADEAQNAKTSAQAPEEIESETPTVRVRDLTSELMQDEFEVTGRTKASRKVSLRSETDGPITSILVQKGDVVQKGQIVAKLAVRDRSAQVSNASQLLNQRQIQYNASKELAEKGFNSRVRLAEARAQLESARAGLKQAKVELSNINIKAPFNAVVNGQMVEVGDYVSKGDHIFDLVDLDPIEIVGFLTEKQIAHARTGSEAKAELLKGQVIEGKITFIAAAANIETRTFEMEMSVPNPDYVIKEGLTAKIKIPANDEQAYKVSPSILSLSDNGSVGVKIVNENNQVEFKNVEILKDTPEYIWIGGLPDSIRLIVVGQEFVIPGQSVHPVQAEGQSLL